MVESSAKILIVGGTIMLLYAFLLGFPLARARTGGTEAPRYLSLAHMGGVMSGTSLLALTFAAAMSRLADGWETLAAWLLVAGAVAVALGELTLWRGKVADAFATKPIGFYLQGIGATSLVAGLAIITVGVVQAI